MGWTGRTEWTSPTDGEDQPVVSFAEELRAKQHQIMGNVVDRGAHALQGRLVEEVRKVAARIQYELGNDGPRRHPRSEPTARLIRAPVAGRAFPCSPVPLRYHAFQPGRMPLKSTHDRAANHVRVLVLL
jgi:hypothetical protein